jgi:hypothetical protein
MKMLPVERISSLRSIGADAGSLGAGKAILSVPAVNATVRIREVTAAEPPPSLINEIGQSNRASTEGLVYSITVDPSQRLQATGQAPDDGRLKPIAPKKADDKPPIPEILIEHLKSLWVASSLAVQTPVPKDEKSASVSDAASPSKIDMGHPLT